MTKEIPSVYTDSWRVEWNECASNGKLDFAGLCNFLQLTAGNHANAGGIGFFDMAANKQAWVLNRMRISVKKMPRWLDTVEVSTWVQIFEGAVSYRNMEICNKGETIAEISSYWVCINTEKRRPEHIAADTSAFPILSDKSVSVGLADRVSVPEKTEKVDTYRVRYSDLDAMGHVNNVKYVQWIFDAMEYETALSIEKCEVEMNFLSELRYGDQVEIRRGQNEGKTVFVICREGQERPAFIMSIVS